VTKNIKLIQDFLEYNNLKNIKIKEAFVNSLKSFKIKTILDMKFKNKTSK
jgi:hypothetical protein